MVVRWTFGADIYLSGVSAFPTTNSLEHYSRRHIAAFGKIPSVTNAATNWHIPCLAILYLDFLRCFLRWHSVMKAIQRERSKTTYAPLQRPKPLGLFPGVGQPNGLFCIILVTTCSSTVVRRWVQRFPNGFARGGVIADFELETGGYVFSTSL